MSVIINQLKRLYFTYFPRQRANHLYRQHFGRDIDWHRPREFNEKIRWMQFYGDTSLWPLLADKYRVRQYIEDKGYGHMLVPLYGVWESAEDIDFSKLPEQFILKTNHGCEGVFAVPDKNTADEADLRAKLQASLNEKFGIISAEPHYLKIKPVVIAEGLLKNDAEFSSSMVDYKLFCFHGEPLIIGVYYDRAPRTHHMNCTFYSADWVRHDQWRKPSIATPAKDIPRPQTLEQMIAAARSLCAPFPFVRFDLYESEGKLYFGEFTFTPGQASGGSLNPEIFQWLGDKIKI